MVPMCVITHVNMTLVNWVRNWVFIQQIHFSFVFAEKVTTLGSTKGNKEGRNNCESFNRAVKVKD